MSDTPHTDIFEAAVKMPGTGGGSTALTLLLALYNGQRFKFNMNDLRRLDERLHAAAVAVIQAETSFSSYVHKRIADESGFPEEAVQAALEWLAFDMDIPGKAKKEQLPKRVAFDFSL